MEPAGPSFDDSGWKQVPLLGNWEEQGYPRAAGTLWFRCRLSLAASPIPLQQPGLMIGRLRYGSYQVYAEGILLGGYPDSNVSVPVPQARAFRIPPELAQRNETLLVALRVRRPVWAEKRAERLLENVRYGEYDRLREQIELGWNRDLLGDVHLLLLTLLFCVFAIFHLFLFERRRSQREYWWFACSLTAFALNTFSISYWIYLLADNLTLVLRLVEISGHLAAAFMIQFLWPLLGVPIGRILRGYQISQVALGVSIAVLPAFGWVVATGELRWIYLLPLLLASIGLIARRAWRGDPDARTLAVGGGLLVLAELHEFAKQVLGWDALGILPGPSLGMTAVVVSMAWLLANRFTRSYSRLDSTLARLHEQTRELQRQHGLLQSVIEGIQEIVFVKDAQGNYQLINSTGAAYLGRTVQELLGKSEASLLKSKDAERVRKDDLAIMAAGRPLTTEAPLTIDGVTRTFLTTKAPYRDGAGNVIGVVGIARDMTERKRAESEIQRHRDDLQQILDAVPVQIAYKDTNNRIIRANRCLAESLGASPQDLADTPASKWYPELSDAFARVDREIFRTGQAHLGKLIRSQVHGEERWFRTDKYPRFNQQGEVTGIVLFAQDITEQRRAEATARQSRKELLRRQAREKEEIAAKLEQARAALVEQTRLATIGQMAASISHELRNPLGVMRNSAYYLRNYSSLPDAKSSQHLAYIEQQISIADGIIGNFLLMARDQPAAKEPVDLEKIVRTVFDEMATTRDQDLELEFRSEAAEIWVDPTQMRLVLHNLFLNAAQAMGGRGTIRLQACNSGNWDEIVVRDEGPGIPEALRQRVFEPLVSGKVKGTGLGLAICRQIVESHQGSIELAETERGAAFRIRLPVRS